MSRELPTPPVPELARAKGSTVSELTDWFVEYYNRAGAPFNYRIATRAVRSAYKGLHSLPILTASCANDMTLVGRTANAEVIRLAAPLVFARGTQVFDLPRRRFSFGRNRHSAYRVPFFFVENGIIHLYFLQPRKSSGLNIDEFGMIATIMKNYLLDQEFYGHTSDVEFVDVSAPSGASIREVRRYALADLPLWSDRRLTDRLTMIAAALDAVEVGGRIQRNHRARPSPDPEMPLFD